MLRKKKWVILGGLILLAICMVVPAVMVLASSSASVKVSGTMPLLIFDVMASPNPVTQTSINASSTITITAHFQNGPPLPDWSINLGASSPGILSNTMVTTGANGQAAVKLTIPTKITQQTIITVTASAGAITGQTNVAFIPSASPPTLTKLVLVALPSPSDFGQTVYFGAAVILPNGNGIPTGTVIFKEGANILGTGQLSFGVTGFSTSSLSVGTHNIQAVYSGDSNYAGSSSNVVVQKVHYDSKITLTSTPNPSSIGQSVTFTAKVTGSSGTPTGNVDFRDGLTVIGSVPLSGGTATFNTSALSAGSHPITASYSGDSNYSVSLSNMVVQVVKDKNKATINLSSSLNPSDVGQSVKFTASVTPKTASGSITFYDGNTSLGSANLSGGSASLSTNKLTVGNHNITAVYSGDTTYAGSTDSLAQKVKGKTACTWPTKPTTVSFGKPCTFSVQIGTQSGTGNPTGAVTFYDGGKTLGTGSLGVDGHATFIISSLSKGTHSITAAYAGDDNFDGSNSNTFSQVIK
jgi:Bacterial Ig-like domain (group 3)